MSTLADRLANLSSTSKKRSQASRLRDVFDHVEKAMKKGTPQIEIIEELNKDGFNLTLTSFRSAIQRIRAERQISPRRASAQPDDSIDTQPATPISDKGNKTDNAIEPKPIPQTKAVEEFVDIFARQAEREAKKLAEKSIQKLPRR